MGFFDDYTDGVEQYADDHVSIEIVNLIVPGSALNVGEVGSFDVQLRNTGPLRMADVTVRIRGIGGVTVKDVGAAAPFVSEFVTDVGSFPNVPAHNTGTSTNSGSYSFKVPTTPLPISDLFEVTLEDWTALLDHIDESRSNGSVAVKATHRDRCAVA